MSRDLVERLRPWIEVSALEAALPRTPRVIVLLGRTSAGKTTLLNRLMGASEPTGLGGVTRELAPHPDGDLLWIDTPGIDDPDAAIDRLSDPLDNAHGVIWVVDGLQPVTHTERRVVEVAVPPGLPLKVLVSRADLFPDEVEAVSARVRELTGQVPSVLDLRRSTLPELRDWEPTAAERTALDDALQQARRALIRVAAPLDPEHFREQTDLRGRVKRLLDDLERRQLSFPDLMQRWRDGLAAIRAERVVAWTADPQLGPHTAAMPELPQTPDPTQDALEVLRMSAAGARNTLRELRSLSGAWVIEAQVVLSDWEVPLDAERAQAFQALLEELA